jgi:hypothetical protein
MTAPVPPTFARRDLLVGAAMAAAAAACGSDDRQTAGGDTLRYQPIASFPRNAPYAAAGVPQRLPFLIAGPDGAPLDHIRGDVTFEVRHGSRRIGRPTRVAPHDAGLTRAYLPFHVTFPDPGTYDLRWHYRGSELETSIAVSAASDVHMPQVGHPLPPVDTPTTDDHRGVDPICTNDPPCPFHTHNLADSLAAHRPVLLLLSTPRYCQTAICGPVLDLLVDAMSTRTDVDVIHNEVYANPDAVPTIEQATQAPLVQAYSMVFEPCLFAVDAGGTLVRRLDTIYDRTELRDAVSAIL